MIKIGSTICVNHTDDVPDDFSGKAYAGAKFWYVKFWYKNGKIHREDGPAVIFSNGTRKWYWNNVLQKKVTGELLSES